MKRFTIRNGIETPSTLELMDEIEDGFFVRIVHRHEEWEDIQEEFMSRELFDTCVRTGYIMPMSA